MPHIIVIAGSNGAGKSTSAPALLNEALSISHFVNADTIAAGLSAFAPEKVAIAAGRAMLERMRHLSNTNQDFAFETTLASRIFAPWIKELKKHKKYIFNLAFLTLDSPDLAVLRVAERVKSGGHSVPEETIRRRYKSGLYNFFNLYLPLADSWQLYNNSHVGNLNMIAEKETVMFQYTNQLSGIFWKMNMAKTNSDDKISLIMNDGEAVRKIIQKGINQALLKHKQAGNAVCGMENGKIVWVKAEDIQINKI